MSTSQPICPHCDTVHNIDDNESYFLYDTDDYEELTCSNCEETFWVKVYTSHSFSTEKKLKALWIL